VGKKAAQILVALGPLLNRTSGLFIRNNVLLCKQLIRPMMDYTCPFWRKLRHFGGTYSLHLQNILI
jgi:hypothetical protein